MIALRDNPPAISPDTTSLVDIAGPWWVAHTRSRHEKALAFDLLKCGVAFFLPMIEKTTVIRGRRFRGMHPLFPGYLFFAGDHEARYQALSTSHVAQVISVLDQARLVHELAQIERALTAQAGLDPFPYLKKGVRCRVVAGSLQGTEGVVVRRRGVTRLVLQVDMLGQAVAAEVDPSLVEPLS
jgi:transcription antitermination factor NusG